MENDVLEQLSNMFDATSLLFILVCFIGMFSHGVKKFLRKELDGSLFEYFFVNNRKRTVYAAFSCLGAAIALIFGEQLPEQAGAFLLMAFTTGFATDSGINKDEIE